MPVARAESLHNDCPSRSRSPEQKVADIEELQRALTALQGLPPRQREVLYLNACEGLTLTEVAQVLDISPEAAKASLSLARQKLRQLLNEPSLQPPQPGDRVP